MLEFLGYGNAIFWIGVLLVVFLASCEFFFNDMSVTIAKYRAFKFPQHPRLQKVCRILFLLTFLLALFAKVGVDWDTRAYLWGDEFIRIMNVLLIYYVLCYPVVITFWMMAKYVWQFVYILFHFAAYMLIWLRDEITAWINGK